MVTLQIFPEGSDPASGVAYAKIPCTVQGGTAKGTWSYTFRSTEVPPASDPAFIFSAHSAWCQYKTSGSMTVQLIRPAITKTEWQDKDGNTASTALVGDTMKLRAETQDLAEGAGIMFAVFNSATGEKVAEPAATMNGTTAEGEWTWHYEHDPAHPLTEKPKFYFTATAPRAKKAKSSDMEISGTLKFYLKNIFNEKPENYKIYLISNDGTSEEVTLEDDGSYEKEDLIPGRYTIKIERNKDE